MINFDNATIEYDLEYGFAWAEDESGKNLFQVSLESRSDHNGFKKEINADDCGWDWGLCGDNNGDATHQDLVNFLKLARKYGFKIV